MLEIQGDDDSCPNSQSHRFVAPDHNERGRGSLLTPVAGEHIDYSLFGVLPAAIERDILIACAPRNITHTHSAHSPGSVVADNLDAKYKPQVFAPAPKPLDVGEDVVRVQGWGLDINTKELKWESYVKAGYYVRICLLHSLLLID